MSIEIDYVPKLVDISDEDSERKIKRSEISQSTSDPPVMETSGEVQNESNKSNISSKKHYSRLCGYLNKQANRGIVKTFRRKWFVFSENNCKLYYYRSPQYQEPIGEIDISQASFMFDATNQEKLDMFTISVPGRVYNLQAKNHQTCLFWLQELQKFRRAYSSHLTEQISSETFSAYSDLFGEPQSGLLRKQELKTNVECHSDDSDLMPSIEYPDDVIGEKSSIGTQIKSAMSMERKSIDIRSQVLKAVNSVWHDKIPEDLAPNIQENELIVNQAENIDFPSNTPLESLVENSSLNLHNKMVCTTIPSQIKPGKTPGLQAFKQRFSASFRRMKSNGDNEQLTTLPKSNDEAMCSKCAETELKMKDVLEDNTSLKEELKACREVINVFRRQLETTVREKEIIAELNSMSSPQKGIELLIVKDHQLTNLAHDCEDLKKEIEKFQKHIISLKKEITDLQQQNEVFQELLSEKDKVVINLTNEVFDLETEKKDRELSQKRCSSSFEIPKSSELIYNDDDKEKLKDSLQAFKLQNKFLNKEILELNHLREDAENRAKILIVKCSEWEARSYQIQSKLLYLLNELNKLELSKKNHDVINRLLQEAVYEDAGDGDQNTVDLNLVSWSRGNLYDQLGFNWKWGKEDLLSIKAANLKQMSADVSNRSKDPDLVSWRSKWDNFIVALGIKELQYSSELKALIRLGIPHEYKGKIWKECVGMKVNHLKKTVGPNYYSLLLSEDKCVSVLDPAVKQIELDLLRTLPNNRHYETLDSEGILKLRRVLLAYSRHDPSVGYCQGLNRLAAIALLFMEEEDAFWCLVAIIKYIMPDNYYNRTLLASQADQGVLKDFISEKLPRLFAHLESLKVDLSLFTFNWFLTVYVDNIPVEIYLRIWDAFLYEGCKVLFRYALAIFKLCENEILEMKDYLSINRFLRNMAENLKDGKRLSHIAFNEMNPFRMKDIISKRYYHMQIVKAQLEELDKMRETFPKSNTEGASAEYQSEDY